MIICCNAFLRVGLDLQSPIYEEKRDLNLLNLPFFLLLFVKLQHDLLYTLICFFWVPWNHSTKSPAKKAKMESKWFLKKSWKPRRFYVASLEIWAAWDPSRCRRLSRDFIQDLDSGLASLRCWIDVYFVRCSVDTDIMLLSLLLSVSLLL